MLAKAVAAGAAFVAGQAGAHPAARELQAAAPSACPVQAPEGSWVDETVWTSMIKGQPAHVMAPFKADLTPPISLPGFCDAANFSSSNWRFVPSQGGDWIAAPVAQSVGFTKTGETCHQTLDGLDVMTRVEGAESLRMHFSGCGKPTANIGVRLTTELLPSTGTGEPTVEGVNLLDFMCQVSPEECERARNSLDGSHGASAALEMSKDKVGLGLCTGMGVEPHTVAGKAAANDCAQECRSRKAANFEDPSKVSCTGYAWSETLKSCIVYSGWNISSSDGNAGEGYYCNNLTVVKESGPSPPVVAPSAPVPSQAATLQLSKLFEDTRAISMRHFIVTPFQAGCFETFDWYILDRWLHVSKKDLQIMEAIGKANTSGINPTAVPPRSILSVERVCVRDCSGQLRDECTAEEHVAPGAAEYSPQPPSPSPAPPAAAAAAVSHAPVQNSVSHEAPSHTDSWLADTIGGPAAEVFEDGQNLPWIVLFALTSMLLGMSLTCLCLCAMGKGHQKPVQYRTVEEVKLIYEGEEEETVALRANPDGTMMSMTSSMMGALGATWQPTKAAAQQTTAARAANVASFNQSAMASRR